MARSMWKKIVVAGPLVMESVYPAVSGRETQTSRGAKRRLSSEAQARMNFKNSRQKLELMLAANFLPGDLVVALTYDDAHLPATRKDAEAKVKAFRAAQKNLSLIAAHQIFSHQLVRDFHRVAEIEAAGESCHFLTSLVEYLCYPLYYSE